jgi:hypothetical protein
MEALRCHSVWSLLVSGGEEMRLFGIGKLTFVSILLYACVVHLPSTHAGCGQIQPASSLDAGYLIHR